MKAKQELWEILNQASPDLVQEVLDYAKEILNKRKCTESENESNHEQYTRSLEARKRFLKLPPKKRHKILAQQADEAYKEYEDNQEDRLQWQSGDFYDY